MTEPSFTAQEGFLPENLTLCSVAKLFSVPKTVYEQHHPSLDDRKHLSKYSFGQRKMIEVLTILYCGYNSNVVILDESFTGLSPLMVEKLIPHIRAASLSKSIIISAHRYVDVYRLSDRTLVLNQGNIYNVANEEDLIIHKYLKR